MGKLVTVNERDEKTGLEEKRKCHSVKGILHRAFTIFIFNPKGELLIQKRSKNKPLWPLTWEASCSSHPTDKESYKAAGKRGLKRELRASCELKLLDKFKYYVKYKNVGSEKELCALLIGKIKGKIRPNPKEVADCKWINLKKLKKEIDKSPREYAPWLKIALKKYNKANEKRK